MLNTMLVSQTPWWCPMCGTGAPRGWGMMMFSMLIWLLVVAVVAVLVWRFASVRGGLLAPGAAPWSLPPSLSVVGRPATIPLTWVPWPPTDKVSVSTKPGRRCTEQVSVSGSHSALRLATTALEPSASRK